MVEYYLAVISLVFGLIVGSFLNVVIYRVPRKESLVRPGSHCPRCGKAIRWYHNVPVAGWIVLRGKCKDCGERISVRYPAVEALIGALFLVSFIVLGIGWQLLIAWSFISVVVVVALIDYDHGIIPAKIVLPATVIGLAASIAVSPSDWWKYLAACFGAAFFFFLLVVIWPGGGMGMGDVYMALLMGAVLGVSVTLALFVAFLTGSVVAVFLVLKKGYGRKSRVRFGPFLGIGAVLAVLAGHALLQSYLTLYA